MASAVCETCGVSFRVAYRPREDRVRRFCSRACYYRARGHEPTFDAERNFWAHTRADPSGCLIWVGARTTQGYGQTTVAMRRVLTAHRQAWIYTHGPIPPGKHVLHHCDVRLCCNPEHLYLGTQQENMRDAVVRGRTAKGSKNGKARLTEAQVIAIRERRTAGGRVVDLAAEFGMSLKGMEHVVYGRHWRHVPPFEEG